jgi:hypothetical protein
MAWNNPPPVNMDQIQETIAKRRSELMRELVLLTKQASCDHDFATKSYLDLGGERNVDVVCKKCGYQWY